ncbi:MAG: 4-diphosphocytidyl-2-C-methyl-D-erythritol kinase [Solirubrobacteraceae bacterium]|nr:4-diphosphocytidyl-2-C-methyl-D-erythritol kinase [Solirubrobacteraceae bacterium]
MGAPRTELAPAKINLCLYLGPTRPDGRHELVSIMQSLTLADRLTLRDRDPATGDPPDEVRCPGVEGPNLCAAALAAFRRATGWDGPGQLLEIEKHVPVAAGMGGGSGDAAATLRLIFARAGIADLELELELAAGLGADVPGQLRPGRVLARGAGERVVRLPDPDPFGVLVLPSRAGLSTAAVYAEADRLGLGRDAGELAAVDPLGRPEYVNDLEPAARSLAPSIDPALELARRLGAHTAMVSGSGPTVIGLFATPAGAREAARALAGRDPAPLAAFPFPGGVRHNRAGES